jgi:hypothetical protein
MSIPSTLAETILHRRLKELADEPGQLEAGQKDRRAALALVDAVAAEAARLMGRAAVRFPEYTLHDQVHLRRVTHLMGVILRESGALEQLSYVEVALLILSAHLHDVGMVPPEDRVAEILTSEPYLLFRAGKRDERAGLRELESLLARTQADSADAVLYRRKIGEIELGILTEYLRIHHGEAGWAWIRERYGDDPRWVLEGRNVAELAAWICRGHALHPHQLTAEYRSHFPVEKLVGQTPVNVLYCALILRLADILDFDRERTPAVLFENISPRNEVSLEQWSLHRSITGWKISRDRIVFEAECTHPAYEKVLREFLDAIDAELQAALNIVRAFPREDGISERYPLLLPPVVDRGRVGALNNAYTYVDLAFTLSHQDIMKLLMGPEFWGGPSLAVRELIQNGYDAIRHRQALERAAGNEWTAGRIILRQRVNEEGRLELSCEDNGIGMTREHLEKYFFRVGKSYYRSPEFERERAGLRGRDADFDPVSQFGLGIVSTFMIGDRLHVRTQRYLGPNRGCADAIEVDVEGMSRMAVMRAAADPGPLPGTQVTIVGNRVDDSTADTPWLKPRWLYDVAKHLALALDVPIEVETDEAFGNVHEVVVPRPRPLRLRLAVEHSMTLGPFMVLEKDIRELFPSSEGTIRLPLLLDEYGRLALDNGVAHWEPNKSVLRLAVLRFDDAAMDVSLFRNLNVLAQDGITVASGLLYTGRERLPTPPQLVGAGTYLVNLKGTDKLPLQPNRHPYSGYSSPEGRRWREFERNVKRHIASAFKDLLTNEALRPLPLNVWPLITIYGIDTDYFAPGDAYRLLPLPVTLPNGETAWMTLQELYKAGFHCIVLPDADTAEPDALQCVRLRAVHAPFSSEGTSTRNFQKLLAACTLLQVAEGHTRYRIEPGASPFRTLEEVEYQFPMRIKFQAYDAGIQEYLFVEHPLSALNSLHAVGQLLMRRTSSTQAGLADSFYNLWYLVRESEFTSADPRHWSEWACSTVQTLSRLWQAVDWAQVPEELRPPYRVLFPGSGRELAITVESIHELLVPARERLKQLKKKDEEVELLP